MLGRLGKPSPMFPPKKGEKGKVMLGRLLLVLHWLAFISAIVTTLWIIAMTIAGGGIRDISQVCSMTWSFLIVFTPFYWGVYKKWVFFPWEHVKPEN